MRRYSEAVQADVRKRMSPPHRQSVAQISQELGIHQATLYNWRKLWRLQGEVVPASEKDPESWSAADKFTVVLETAGFNATELSSYCRERGLFAEQVDRWRQTSQDANANAVLTMAEQRDLEKRHQRDQKEIQPQASPKEQALKQDLRLKENALAVYSTQLSGPQAMAAALLQPQASAQRLRGATLDVRLEELGVLRSFSRPRVSNDNPYPESLFRTVKYRPNYPNRPFSSKEEACQWVSSFVDWYNHQHRHSGIKFVTPQQRHCGEAIEICRQRSRVYELARIANPKRWSRSIRCWKQPDLVWINPPADDFIAHTAKLKLAA